MNKKSWENKYRDYFLNRIKLFDNLRMLPHVPGVQMQRKIYLKKYSFDKFVF
jgi:hypothetical protein